jgi:hypothetical protein
MHGDEGLTVNALKEMIMIDQLNLLNLETSFVQDAFLTHCLFMPRTTQSKSLSCQVRIQDMIYIIL